MPHKAILFDLDGTLLDTLYDLGDAVNRALSLMGFPTHPLGDYRGFIGDGAVILITRALPRENRNETTIRTCLQAFREIYDRNWNVKTRPYDSIPEVLDTLATRGMKMAVLSNKPHGLTIRCVTHLLPNCHFDAVLGQREEAPRKPNPAGALEIAERLHIPPSAFFYLGDSAVDMKTAVAAEMFPVGVLWGFRTADELQENGAKVLIDHPSKILDLPEILR